MSGLMEMERPSTENPQDPDPVDGPPSCGPPSCKSSNDEVSEPSEISSITGDHDSGFGVDGGVTDPALDTATDTCSTSSPDNASSVGSVSFPLSGKEQPISVLQPSKIEREMSRISISAPSTGAVFIKWVVTIILGIICYGCIVVNSISFSGIAVRLYSDNKLNMTSCRPFVMILLILLIPNFMNLLRAVWVGLTRNDMPWPKSTSVAWILLISILESAGITIFAFKIFTLKYGLYGLLTSGSIFLLPVLSSIFLLRRSGSNSTLTKYAMYFGFASVLLGTAMVFWKCIEFLNSNEIPMSELWHLVLGVVILSICWTPHIQKKLITSNIPMENDHDATGTSRNSVMDSSSDHTYVLLRDSIFHDDQNEETTKDSCWKSTFLQCLFRIPALTAFSFLFFYIDNTNNTLQFHTMLNKIQNSFSWQTSELHTQLFIINVFTGLVGYSVALAACRVNMQRGAFVLPVVVAPPTVFFLYNVEWICKHLFDDQTAVCTGNIAWPVIIVSCMFMGMLLSYGVILWETRNLVLHPESDLYWVPAYSGILLPEWLFLGRRLQRIPRTKEEPRDHGRKTAVYICTTMYRETLEEMRQLLESIGQINLAQAHCDRHFESHIFFDGGVKDRTPTEFALQLISLLPAALNISVDSCTKASTPYGLRLTWRIPIPGKVLNEQSGMIFMIHLKDNRKVKNQKRWSQIMYMSYILDFLNCQTTGDTGNRRADDESFILTTDADVKFTPDSVEALLDLMARDKTVGAVCARTHPLGSGPVVWYQIFEYAIGHWFQKAAEHVLGSVLCAPGCFSVYRLRAVRDVVKTYASDVEEAFDFLIKDMGEDRWFGTLMIQSGWRIEYCAAAENSTCCPEDFEEFYKQRRRWIVSTVANLMLLMKEWHKVSRFNHRVSILFTTYQALLLISTLIGPSVVILVVSGGLLYGWGVNVFTSIALQCIVSVSFAFICLYTHQSTQMMIAKIMTLIYACVMLSVFIGIAENIVNDYRNGGVALNSTVLDDPDAVVVYIPMSLATMYLALLAAIFIITGLLHPSELSCLIHGIWYLLCLPSGYLVLNIYSIANMTDRSWGTREEATKQTLEFDKNTIFQFIRDVRNKCCFCFRKRKDELLKYPVLSYGSTRVTSLSESHPSPKAISEVSGKFSEDSFGKTPKNSENDVEHSDWKESSTSSEDFSEWFPEEDIPVPVEEWLDRELREEYLYKFQKHGFDNTIFISAMKESDLVKIGIKKKSHLTYLMQQIQDLPSFHIETRIPDDVLTWLQDIGLEMYYANFRCNKLTVATTLEVLKSITPKEIEQELKITKAGHVKRLMYAIKQLRNPTQEERRRMQVKRDLENTPYHKLENFNRGELKFWRELKEACLQPFSVAFGHTQELKDKLANLRNNFLLIIAITNTLWLILLITLGTKMELRIMGTDAVGLAFLCIFGCIYVLQFLCMLVHRVMTFGHFCARAPYGFNQSYNKAWSFKNNREFEVSKTLNPHDIQVIAAAKEAEKNSRTILKEKRKSRRRRAPVYDQETGKEMLLVDSTETIPYGTFNHFSLR